MVVDNTFLKNAGINPGVASDLSFVVLDAVTNDVVHMYRYKVDHSTSVGSIQSILEMNMLMTRSLAIISPNLVFSPDFPDYLLSEDDPKYMQTIPMITPELYRTMPHFRWDLYERNFDDYGTLEKIPAPHITWGVVRQEPGTVSSKPFQGTQELKPRERELVLVFDKDYKSILETNSDNKFIEKNDKLYKYVKVKGQFIDSLVQYNIWARTNWEVEELTDWFQRQYMLPYTGMFREAGVNNLYFDRRVRDDTLMQMKNKYHLRSILYYIRTEHIYNDTIMPITRIDVDLDVIASAAEFTINNELANYYDRIIDRWHFNNKT